MPASKTGLIFLFLFSLIILSVFSLSCKSSAEKNDIIFKALEKSLESSNRSIDISTEITRNTLQNKKNEPGYRFKAEM